ncbi:hypothetical protein AAJCM20276_27050 [Acetobacter aceti]|uniref:Addiction module toxin RelE n=1 Tax=Acetobacter aceti TaxID=435 RepID=A0A6S6PN15_ACEAC|nr:type II toxin-antitoxin system RelE/ParE family toxin [Acetobacter aceti]BCI68081.1 hypothetical protein AAJCM20276_27050 [Acetobacter aceti]
MDEPSELHSVCELKSFRNAAFASGLDEQDISLIVDILSKNPQAGDVMQGTGGCRKLRFAKKGTGKSGGYRTITFYGGSDLPVFLLTVFGKSEKANLTKAERNKLAGLTKIITDSYRGRVVKVGTGT